MLLVEKDYDISNTKQRRQMSANLRASNARQISAFGTGNVSITTHMWSALSCWNASMVLNHSNKELVEQEASVVRVMETSPIAAERFKSKHIWVNNVLDAIMKKKGSQDFLCGEESTNWPKIKQSRFPHGIAVSLITQIIMEHRDSLKKWAHAQAEIKEKSIKSKLLKHEMKCRPEEPEPTAFKCAEEIVIPPEVPENWEDLLD